MLETLQSSCYTEDRTLSSCSSDRRKANRRVGDLFAADDHYAMVVRLLCPKLFRHGVQSVMRLGDLDPLDTFRPGLFGEFELGRC